MEININNASSSGVVAEQITQDAEVVAGKEVLSEEAFDEYIDRLKSGTITEPGNAEEADNGGNITDEDEKKEEVENKNEEADEIKPYMTFDSEEAVQEFINSRVGDRLRESREATERLGEVLANAKAFYGDGDDEKLLKALVDDLKAQAENNGISDFDDAVSRAKDERSRQTEDRLDEQVRDIQAAWRADEERLKGIVPGFELMTAFKNEAFRNAVLKEGKDVITAYFTLNKQTTRPEPTVKNAISEVGKSVQRMSGQSPVKDVSKLSDEEFDKYIKRLKG